MRSSSGKKINNPSFVDRMWRMWVNSVVSDITEESKYINKVERMNSEKFKAEQDGRNIAQFMTKNKKELVLELREVASATVRDIITQITIRLQISSKAKKVNDYTQPHVSFEQIKSIIQEYMPALKKLKKLCENENIIPEVAENPTIYDKMFAVLIELDARFALFATKLIVNQKKVDIKLEGMSEEFQEKIQQYTASVNESGLDYVDTFELREDSKSDEVNKIVDNIVENEFKARFAMVETVEMSAKSLYKYIIEQLNLQDFDEKTLMYKDIKKVLLLCSAGIKSLKQYSENINLNEIAGWDEYDPYTELFNNLINLNIKFAFFAPKKSLNRLDIDFKRLSEKERSIMLKVLIDYGLWDNDEYYKNYKDLFVFSLNDTI